MVAGAALADVLSSGIRLLWPSRTHQERLLDLGEHKGWDESDLSKALRELSTWLISELGIPPRLQPLRKRRGGRDEDVRNAAEALAAKGMAAIDRSSGVGLGTTRLSILTGTTAKTLSNSLLRGLRFDRKDHLWLRALSRIAAQPAPLDAWLYHRRHVAAVSEELRLLIEPPDPDAGTALMLLSLIALWQRRRTPEAARGARGQRLSRRLLPKPVAAMSGTLLTPGQLVPLASCALALGHAEGHALAALALEAALTEAHLLPHPPRRSRASSASATNGEVAWLDMVDRQLRSNEVAGLLAEDAPLFRFRVARMRAWRSRTATPASENPASTPDNAYVALSLSFEQALINGRSILAPVSASAAGALMLLPQARRMGVPLSP